MVEYVITLHFEVYRNYEFHPENYDSISEFKKTLARSIIDSSLKPIDNWCIEGSDIEWKQLLTNTPYYITISTTTRVTFIDMKKLKHLLKKNCKVEFDECSLELIIDNRGEE